MIVLVELVIVLVELVDVGNNSTNAGPLGLIYIYIILYIYIYIYIYIYYVYICLSLKIVGGPLFFEFGPQTAANGSPRRPYSGDKNNFCQKKKFPLHFGHFLPDFGPFWVVLGRFGPRWVRWLEK